MKLFFRTYGTGDPLIILHGLFGMSDNWASLARQYGTEGFCVYTPDLRNHGQSPHAGDFTLPSMADDVLELMDSEKCASAHLVGHSLGGKVAMYLACMHPERVAKLVVSDMAPRGYEAGQEDVLAALHAVDPETVSSRSEAESLMERHVPLAGTRQFLLKSLYWKEGEGSKKLAWRFNVPVIEENLDQAGAAVPDGYHFDGPVLFIRGEKSEYITTRDYNDIKEHFPMATVETVPKAGHWVHADNPKGFSEVLMRFLRNEK